MFETCKDCKRRPATAHPHLLKDPSEAGYCGVCRTARRCNICNGPTKTRGGWCEGCSLALAGHQDVMARHATVPPAAVDPLRALRRWLARLRATYGRPVDGPVSAQERALADDLLRLLGGEDCLDPAVPRKAVGRREAG